MTPHELREALTKAIERRDATVPDRRNDPALSSVGGTLHAALTCENDAALRRYVEADALVTNLRHKLGLAEAREQEAARARLTYDDVKGATIVRDRFGWHRVVRISAKSVTVETPYSWTDRIAIDKILQVAS